MNSSIGATVGLTGFALRRIVLILAVLTSARELAALPV
jgi:hypothetical protein